MIAMDKGNTIEPRIPGFEKIIIYVSKDGITQHAARQMSDGKWTSKLGRSFDVKHDCINRWSDTIIGLLFHRLSDYG
ncbi:hypothetical protein IID04_02010 [PVC group bacterium]|nr:hypothetical protein [PVC group bacterium]